jgi:hypothetical protein
MTQPVPLPLVARSPDGTLWRLGVDNEGALTVALSHAVPPPPPPPAFPKIETFTSTFADLTGFMTEVPSWTTAPTIEGNRAKFSPNSSDVLISKDPYDFKDSSVYFKREIEGDGDAGFGQVGLFTGTLGDTNPYPVWPVALSDSYDGKVPPTLLLSNSSGASSDPFPYERSMWIRFRENGGIVYLDFGGAGDSPVWTEVASIPTEVTGPARLYITYGWPQTMYISNLNTGG